MKEFYKNYIPLFPILFLALTLLFTTIKNLFFNGFNFPVSNYFALLLLIFNAYIFFKNRRLYKYILGLTFLLAYTNLIRFTFNNYSASLSIGEFKISFIPTITIVIIMTYILNFSRINRILGKLVSTSLISDVEYEQKRFSTEFNDYLEKYASFDNEKLLKIINDERYLLEAREAAKHLLNSKNLDKPAHNTLQ